MPPKPDTTSGSSQSSARQLRTLQEQAAIEGAKSLISYFRERKKEDAPYAAMSIKAANALNTTRAVDTREVLTLLKAAMAAGVSGDALRPVFDAAGQKLLPEGPREAGETP